MQVTYRILVAVLFWAIACIPSRAEPCDSNTASFAVEFGKFVSWERKFLNGSSKTVPLPPQGVRYARILFKQLPVAGAEWTITIRDGDGRPLQTIASDHADSNEPFWSRRLYADRLKVENETKSDRATVASLLLQVVLDSPIPFYSIKGADPDWSDLYDPDDDAGGIVENFWKREGESIGMFVTTAGNNLDGFSMWTCSGVLIADTPDLLFLTNDHCGGKSEPRWTASTCRGNGFVDFSWDGDAVSRQHDCSKVVARSADLDVAVLRLNRSESDAAPRPVRFASRVKPNEPLFLIHHPVADSKKLSRGCVPVTSNITGTLNLANDFGHQCDTDAGSSGAPVLSKDGDVVGIHHTGHEKSANGTCDRLNKAVRVENIIEFLNANGLQDKVQVRVR